MTTNGHETRYVRVEFRLRRLRKNPMYGNFNTVKTGIERIAKKHKGTVISNAPQLSPRERNNIELVVARHVTCVQFGWRLERKGDDKLVWVDPSPDIKRFLKAIANALADLRQGGMIVKYVIGEVAEKELGK